MRKQRIETAKRSAVAYRNYRRARDRALVRLAQAYPNQYKEYLEQEKAYDEKEGKKWVDITGRTAPARRKAVAYKRASKSRAKSSNQRKNSRHNGGKK